MNIFTKAVLKALPPLGTNAEKEFHEVKVPLKLFNAMGGQSWFITEYDPEEELAFGFANLGDDQNAELGYISIRELKAIKSVHWMLERDRYWEPKTTLDKVISFEVR